MPKHTPRKPPWERLTRTFSWRSPSQTCRVLSRIFPRMTYLVICAGNHHNGPWPLPHIPPPSPPLSWHDGTISPTIPGFGNRRWEASIPFAQGQWKLPKSHLRLCALSPLPDPPNPGGTNIPVRMGCASVTRTLRRQRPHRLETVPPRVPSDPITMGDRSWKFVVVHMNRLTRQVHQQPMCKGKMCSARFAAHHSRGQTG